MEINKYNNWDLFEEMPIGWKVDKTIGSPLYGYICINNGKSLLNGGKKALLKIKKTVKDEPKIQDKPTIIEKEVKKVDINYTYPSHSVNTLARKMFQEQLLKEIMFDLMVCEIEGWDKLEYLVELKNLINGIKTNKVL